MKKIKYWIIKIQNWYNTTEKRVSRETAKETILFNLLNERSTKESIELYNEVETIFKNKMSNRLLNKTNEKVILENFLK